MKTFRIHLKDGKSFTVQAHHFVRGHTERFTFYKSESEADGDIWVFTENVVAIVPEAEAPAVAANVTRSSSGVHVR